MMLRRIGPDAPLKIGGNNGVLRDPDVGCKSLAPTIPVRHFGEIKELRPRMAVGRLQIDGVVLDGLFSAPSIRSRSNVREAAIEPSDHSPTVALRRGEAGEVAYKTYIHDRIRLRQTCLPIERDAQLEVDVEHRCPPGRGSSSAAASLDPSRRRRGTSLRPMTITARLSTVVNFVDIVNGPQPSAIYIWNSTV